MGAFDCEFELGECRIVKWSKTKGTPEFLFIMFEGLPYNDLMLPDWAIDKCLTNFLEVRVM